MQSSIICLTLVVIIIAVSANMQSDVEDTAGNVKNKISNAATDVKNKAQDVANEVTDPKEGRTWCPVPLVGTRCPDGTIFHYYSCCGQANKECCFNLQMWLVVVLVIIGILVIAGVVLVAVRHFCRESRRRSHA
jgi:hypothetical protein